MSLVWLKFIATYQYHYRTNKQQCSEIYGSVSTMGERKFT